MVQCITIAKCHQNPLEGPPAALALLHMNMAVEEEPEVDSEERPQEPSGSPSIHTWIGSLQATEE